MKMKQMDCKKMGYSKKQVVEALKFWQDELCRQIDESFKGKFGDRNLEKAIAEVSTRFSIPREEIQISEIDPQKEVFKVMFSTKVPADQSLLSYRRDGFTSGYVSPDPIRMAQFFRVLNQIVKQHCLGLIGINIVDADNGQDVEVSVSLGYELSSGKLK